MFSFESGLFDEWLHHTRDAMITRIRRETQLFESFEDYADAYSSSVSSRMQIENLQSLFSFFFGAQLLILFVFALIKKGPILLLRIDSLLRKIYLDCYRESLRPFCKRSRNKPTGKLVESSALSSAFVVNRLCYRVRIRVKERKRSSL